MKKIIIIIIPNTWSNTMITHINFPSHELLPTDSRPSAATCVKAWLTFRLLAVTCVKPTWGQTRVNHPLFIVWGWLSAQMCFPFASLCAWRHLCKVWLGSTRTGAVAGSEATSVGSSKHSESAGMSRTRKIVVSFVRGRSIAFHVRRKPKLNSQKLPY